MKESQLQKKILDLLKDNGYSVFKTIACNRNGVSDIIGCTPSGTFLAIEVKAPGKLSTVSKLQMVYLKEVQANEGIAFPADSVETVKRILNI